MVKLFFNKKTWHNRFGYLLICAIEPTFGKNKKRGQEQVNVYTNRLLDEATSVAAATHSTPPLKNGLPAATYGHYQFFEATFFFPRFPFQQLQSLTVSVNPHSKTGTPNKLQIDMI